MFNKDVAKAVKTNERKRKIMDQSIKQLIKDLNDRYDAIGYDNDSKTCGLILEAVSMIEHLVGEVEQGDRAIEKKNRVIKGLEEKCARRRAMVESKIEEIKTLRG